MKENKKDKKLKLINIDKIISSLGIKESIDLRLFYGTKSLYSVNFYKAYAEFINPLILSLSGKSKKVLIFDCDNTLWHGVLGEDGRAIRLPGYDTITVDAQSALGRLGSKIGEEITDLPQSMVRGETQQWIDKKIYGDPKRQTLPRTTLPLEGLSYTQPGELPETLLAVNSYNNLNNNMYSPNPYLPYNKQNMQIDYGQGGIYGV